MTDPGTGSTTTRSASLSPSSSFTVAAPGRICLFGEHSDYLGFPVIASAIPLFCQIDVEVVKRTTTVQQRCNDDSGNRRRDRSIILYLHVPKELGTSKVYDLNNLPPSPPRPFPPPIDSDGNHNQSGTEASPDFALAAIHEVLKEGFAFDSLFDGDDDDDEQEQQQVVEVHCTSRSDELPVQAGCSSSTAFLVGWVLVLAKLANRYDVINDPIRLARLTHQAEVIHFGHPGGTMDHVSIALGTTTDQGGCGAIRIGPDPWEVERLPPLHDDSHNDDGVAVDSGVWILADSGEPKDTLKHLRRCKHDRVNLLQEKLQNDWDNIDDVQQRLSNVERRLWKATIINRNTEQMATTLWRSGPRESDNTIPPSPCEQPMSLGHRLALLMKDHHDALRDGLGLSTTRLEAINDAAIEAGSWGFKVVGSGGGGCGVAWCPTGLADAVAERMQNAGAIRTWIFDSRKPVRGAHIK
jgi:galactokinase